VDDHGAAFEATARVAQFTEAEQTKLRAVVERRKSFSVSVLRPTHFPLP
jgi:hypothetical protein